MVDSRGRWTEWRFVPALLGVPDSPTRRSFIEANEDARAYVAERFTHTPEGNDA
jgi:hypothetical protein